MVRAREMRFSQDSRMRLLTFLCLLCNNPLHVCRILSRAQEHAEIKEAKETTVETGHGQWEGPPCWVVRDPMGGVLDWRRGNGIYGNVCRWKESCQMIPKAGGLKSTSQDHLSDLELSSLTTWRLQEKISGHPSIINLHPYSLPKCHNSSLQTWRTHGLLPTESGQRRIPSAKGEELLDTHYELKTPSHPYECGPWNWTVVGPGTIQYPGDLGERLNCSKKWDFIAWASQHPCSWDGL